MERKIVQIAAAAGDLKAHQKMFALCDDGSVWAYSYSPGNENWNWKLIPPIPQTKPDA